MQKETKAKQDSKRNASGKAHASASHVQEDSSIPHMDRHSLPHLEIEQYKLVSSLADQLRVTACFERSATFKGARLRVSPLQNISLAEFVEASSIICSDVFGHKPGVQCSCASKIQFANLLNKEGGGAVGLKKLCFAGGLRGDLQAAARGPRKALFCLGKLEVA